MQTPRIAPVALVVFSCLTVSPLAAQSDDERMNVMARRRAESLRVGDYCSLAEEIVAAPAIAQRLGDASQARAQVLTICAPEYEELSLLQLTAGVPFSFSEVARVGTREFVEGARRVTLAMSNFRALVSQPNVQPVLATGLSPQRHTAWITMSDTWAWTENDVALSGAMSRLSRYERKYGPSSPRPNGAEIVVNYLAQQFLPGFKPNPLRGPASWEFIASYAPAYVTRIDERYTPIAGAEFGLRRYMYGEGFGKSGIRGIFRPSYWSVGALTTSHLNGALIYPWRGRERTGGFISWGSIKVGYVKRGEGEWMVSKQFQAIPFVF